MTKTLIAAALFGAAGLAQAQSATYAIDPTHTFVIFEVKHFETSTVRGRFDKKEGSVTLDKAGKSGHAEIAIDMAAIDTGVPALDKHLKSADFFNVAEFPGAKFVGDKFSFNGDKLSSVAGELTLLGKTLPVTLNATNFNCYINPMLKREACGGDFEATLQRSQWGMGYGMAFGLPDSVHLLIQIEAIKQ